LQISIGILACIPQWALVKTGSLKHFVAQMRLEWKASEL
jgi:hypothetical protein